jgi:hypothetical protein
MQQNGFGMGVQNLGVSMGNMGIGGMESVWPMGVGMGMGVGGMGVNMMGMPMPMQGMGAAPYGHFNPTLGVVGPWMDGMNGGAGWDASGMEGMMGGV